jgi:hypothetical protein
MRLALVISSLLALSTNPAMPADEPIPIVQGDYVSQFELVGIKADTISIKDGEVRLTGKPNGYFATKKGYKNYVLTFEWMYERPETLESEGLFNGNSGLLVHITGEHKVWPKCTEVQLANSDAGNIFAINGAKFTGKKDAEAQKKAIKSVGQWNAEEVTCKDGEIICRINGVEVARGTGASPDEGTIGWQSEGAPIRFRKLMIRVLD